MKIMKWFNPSLVLFIVLLCQCSGAAPDTASEYRSSVFEIFSFKVPADFIVADFGSSLSLSAPEAKGNCSFLFISSSEGSDQPMENLRIDWQTILQPMLESGASMDQPSEKQQDQWQELAVHTNLVQNGEPLVSEFRSFSKGTRKALVVVFYKEGDSEAARKTFAETLHLANDASENGPAAHDYYFTGVNNPVNPDLLSGVWTPVKADSLSYFTKISSASNLTFLDNGDAFLGTLPYGNYGVDRELQKKDPALRTWATYTLQNNAGTLLTSTGESHTFRVDKDTTIWYDSIQYIKCASVTGFRMEGTWRDDFAGTGTTLMLNLASQFTDSGIFSALHAQSPWLFAGEKGGEGTYMIYDHTLVLRYADGRVRTLSFSGIGPYELRETNRVLLIGANRFIKQEDEPVNYRTR